MSWRRVRDQPGGARVYQIALQGGDVVVGAWFADAGKFAREVAAYEALRGDELVPTLLGVDAGERVVLVAHVTGVRASSLPATSPEWVTVMEDAGGWLARLHRRPVWQVDEVPLGDAYRARVERVERELGAREPAVLTSALRARLDALPSQLEGCVRVPCHRDFTPDNWLVDPPHLRGVIDFEHARSDLPEADVARLVNEGWLDAPERRRAFMRGYEASDGPAKLEGYVVRDVALLEALTTLAWALRHRDVEREHAARRALARSTAMTPSAG